MFLYKKNEENNIITRNGARVIASRNNRPGGIGCVKSTGGECGEGATMTDTTEKMVIDILTGNVNEVVDFKCIGELNYLYYIRPMYTKTDNSSIKIDNKSSKNKPRYTVFNTKVLILKDSIKNINESSIKIPNSIINMNIIEFNGIYLLSVLNLLMSEKNKKQRIHNIKFITTLCMGIQQFVNSCSELVCSNYILPDETITVSETFIKDMNKLLNKCKSRFNFMDSIYTYNPSLSVTSGYENVIPGIKIQPRPSQKKVLTTFTDNYDNGVLIFNKSMIGSGKTTLIGPVAKYCSKKPKTKLIFCCNILSVRKHAAAILAHLDINYTEASIVTKFYTESGSVSKTKTDIKDDVVEFEDNKSNVVITTSDVTELMLSRNSSTDYVLFMDEPTVGLDNINIKTRNSVISSVNILKNLPKRTILVSATMPLKDSNTVRYIMINMNDKYDNIKIEYVVGNEVFVGCDIFTDDTVVRPYNNCGTKKELDNSIRIINENPFMGRMCSFNAYKDIITKSNVSYDDKFNIDVANINISNIKECIIKHLKAIDGDDIIKITSATAGINGRINMNLLGTKEAYKFDKMTLITLDSNNLLSDTKSLFKDLLYEMEYMDIYKLFNDYDSSKNAINGSIKAIEKSKDHIGDDKKKIISDIKHNSVPRIKFPSYLIINSKEHFNRYNSGKEHESNVSYRKGYILESLYDSKMLGTIDNDLLGLLLCGVGIYSPLQMNKAYTDVVMDLSSGGYLSYVVSNNEISYGTNYPFGKLIITEGFIKKYSINTIFQLMGRTGRVGKCYTSNIYVPELFHSMLMDYINSQDKYETEEVVLYDMLIQTHEKNNSWN